MRPALAALLLAAAPAAAQHSAYDAEVSADAVAVRCGPSEQLPETGQLFRGTRVTVEREEPNGWVAIRAPRGQVSWINHKFLGPAPGQPDDVVPRNAIVHSEGVADVAAGRPGHGKPLDVRRTQVPDQTVVLVIGQKVVHNNSTWYPIEPPDGDLRYVPKSAVRFVGGKPAAEFVVRSPDPKVTPAGGAEPVPASIPNRPATTTAGRGKAADWPNHPLWHQAEQAERAADYPKAETLYLKLAAEMNQPGGDAELANLCYARVHAVREKMRQGKGTSTGKADPPAAEGRWVGPGLLRRVTFKIDGREAYALEGDRGQVKCYAVPAGDVDLDRYVRSDVILYGQLSYSPDLRAWVVTASRLQLDRNR